MKRPTRSKRRLNWIIASFIGSLLFVLGISCTETAPPNSRWAQANRGKEHFKQYCASCHGEDGKGLKIDTLDVLPANLTEISMRRNGEFPILEIARIVDGRKLIKGHGRAMPVWGDVFATQEELTEAQIKGKLGEILAYLMSIQGK